MKIKFIRVKRQTLLALTVGLLAMNIAHANNKDTPEQEELIAQKLFKEGHYREALPFISRAIEGAPNRAYYYQERGRALLELEERKEAEIDFQKALELEPTLAGVYPDLSRCEFELGRMPNAIAQISKGIQIEKRPCINAKMLTRRAAYYLQLKRNKEAIDDLNKSILLCPHDYWNLKTRAETYYNTKEYKKAVEDYTMLLNSKDSLTHARGELKEMRARCYEKLGRKDLADLDRKDAHKDTWEN